MDLMGVILVCLMATIICVFVLAVIGYVKLNKISMSYHLKKISSFDPKFNTVINGNIKRQLKAIKRRMMGKTSQSSELAKLHRKVRNGDVSCDDDMHLFNEDTQQIVYTKNETSSEANMNDSHMLVLNHPGEENKPSQLEEISNEPAKIEQPNEMK